MDKFRPILTSLDKYWFKFLKFQVLKFNTLMNFERTWSSKGRMGMGFNAPSAELFWLKSLWQKPMFSECTSLLNITNVIYVMRQSNINSISENILVKNTSKEARIWSKTMLYLYQGQIIKLKSKENQNKSQIQAQYQIPYFFNLYTISSLE